MFYHVRPSVRAFRTSLTRYLENYYLSCFKNAYYALHYAVVYNQNLHNLKLGRTVRDRNLRQARSAPPARNGSHDVVDHVTNRFAICHLL